jgi:hypothetical protein
MKKISILPLLAILISASSANAQITKGSLFLGGNIGVSSQKVESTSINIPYKQNYFTISPVFGKVIRENLVLGIDAGISFYKQEQYDASSKQKQNSYSGGIFLRQYKQISKSFYLFLQERLGYRYDKYNASYTNSTPSDFKRHTIGLNVNPGIAYALNRKLHLETGFNNLLSLYYSHEKGNNYNSSSSGSYKSNNFNAGVDLNGFSSLYIGFRVLIGK